MCIRRPVRLLRTVYYTSDTCRGCVGNNNKWPVKTTPEVNPFRVPSVRVSLSVRELISEINRQLRGFEVKISRRETEKEKEREREG